MRFEEAQDLFAFNRWAAARTFAAIEALTEEQRRATIVSSFPSIAATLAHIVSAEWVWLERWHGRSVSAPPAWVAEADFTSVRAKFNEVDLERDALLASLGPDGMTREVTYRTLAGAEGRNVMADMIRHVVNHGTYHRGQIATMLRQLGAAPPSIDYIVFARERK